MNVDEFFHSVQQSHPQYGEDWKNLASLYNRKLWHQLTLSLEEFVPRMILKAHPGEIMVKNLYNFFIKKFEAKMNQTSFVQIVLLLSDRASNPQEALQFMQNVAEMTKHVKPAFILAQMRIADLYLGQEKLVECKQIIDQVQTLIDGTGEDFPLFIHANFYIVSAQFYKVQGSFSEFYADALRYLACVDVSTLAANIRAQRAFDLGLAALLSSNIYNFGELVVHPILEYLKGTQNEWLYEFLCAFNNGDISTFEKLKPKWSTQHDLNRNEKKLREKISLLALLNLIFYRPPELRKLSFQDIAKAAHLQDESHVELLLIRALSLKLIRGVIDQVDHHIQISWIKPKVLNREQIKVMNSKLAQWSQTVSSTRDFVHDSAIDLTA